MRNIRLKNILMSIYKKATPIDYGDSFISSENIRRVDQDSFLKRKKQIRDLTSDVPEDIIVMDQNLLRHPESISGLIAFNTALNKDLIFESIMHYKDSSGTVTVVMSEQELSKYAKDIQDLYKRWSLNIDKNIYSDDGEYINEMLIDQEDIFDGFDENIDKEKLNLTINNIVSSIDNFKDKILTRSSSDRILFVPLIFGRKNITTKEVSDFYKAYLDKNPDKKALLEKEEGRVDLEHDSNYHRRVKSVENVGSFDKSPDFLVHDVMGHSLGANFTDFAYSLNNFLKELDKEVSIFPGIRSRYAYDYEGVDLINDEDEVSLDIRDDPDALLRETSEYIGKIQSELGFKQTEGILGFNPQAYDSFDKINDAFVMISKSNQLPRELPKIKSGRKTFNLSNGKANTLYLEYLNSIKREKEKLVSDSPIAGLKGRIVFQTVSPI